MASIASRQGLQALVTRPREEAEKLAAALAARGIGTLIEPLMEVHFRAAAWPDLTGVQAVLCTSANGVRALARASVERRLPLFAVGDATAERAHAEGFSSVASAGGDAADLVRLAAAQLDPREGRLLHVCGSAVAGDLAGDLRGRGFAVERSILYEARPIAALSPAATDAIRSGVVDFALFFSPRTAAIFVRLVDDAGVASGCRTIAALSISITADAALASLPWRERRIADRPEQRALLVALDRLLAERRPD
jgi:uroporphyrinogen-III synthase